MPKTSWAFVALAVPMVGLVGASFCVHVSLRVLLLAGPGGCGSLVLAGVAWMLDRLPEERDADAEKDALVYALRDITLRRGLARTLPLKRVV